EHVLAALLRLDESVAFCRVEPLHCTCRHVDLHIGPTAHQHTRFAKRAEARIELGPLLKHGFPSADDPRRGEIGKQRNPKSFMMHKGIMEELPWGRKRNSGTSRAEISRKWSARAWRCSLLSSDCLRSVSPGTTIAGQSPNRKTSSPPTRCSSGAAVSRSTRGHASS